MPKRIPKRSLKVLKRASPVDRLAKTLGKQKKADLVALILELASNDRSVMRMVESRFVVNAPSDQLVDSTRQAIADATDFDERQINFADSKSK